MCVWRVCVCVCVCVCRKQIIITPTRWYPLPPLHTHTCTSTNIYMCMCICTLANIYTCILVYKQVQPDKFDVILTSFEIVCREKNHFKKFHWFKYNLLNPNCFGVHVIVWRMRIWLYNLYPNCIGIYVIVWRVCVVGQALLRDRRGAPHQKWKLAGTLSQE